MRGLAITFLISSGMLLCRDLDVDPAGFGEEDERLLAGAVDRDREVIFVLDIEPLLGKDLLDGEALDLFCEEFLCQLRAGCLVRHQDTAGLAPAADIHLCLQDDRVAEFAEMGGEFVCRLDQESCRDGDPGRFNDVLCLVFA